MLRCRLSRIASAVEDDEQSTTKLVLGLRERERATHRSDGFICTVFSQEKSIFTH